MNDSTPDPVKYGLISAAKYHEISLLYVEAEATDDWTQYALACREICEDNVPLFSMLFMGYDSMPHIFKEWPKIKANNRILVRLPRGHGKALALDTPIPTPDGMSTQGELRIGDRVFDENGKPCNVVGLTAIEEDRDCYRVTFNDGTSIVADGEHEWFTRTKEERTPRKRKSGLGGRVRTTVEISEKLKVGGQKPESNHSIDVCGAWELPERELPIDPYLLGIWLGDGTSRQAQITTADPEIVESFRECGYPIKLVNGCEIQYQITDGVKHPNKPESLHAKLRALNLFENKHIPEEYMLGSKGQRMALLQGLMDSDGTANPASKQLSFTSTLPELAEQFAQLASSLGIITHTSSHIPKITNRPDAICKRAFTVSFTTPQPVFRLPRKLEAQRLATKGAYSHVRRFIRSIEKVESVPVRCIQVDSDSHLYLASKAAIPTHNSEVFTRALITHRICYATVAGSKHEDPRVLAIFGTKDKIDDAMGSIMRNIIEVGGPGNLIGLAFPAPGGLTIAEYARAKGAWKQDRVDFPLTSGGVRRNPVVRCATMGKRIAGLHPKTIIMDDAIEEIDARSELRRESAWAFFQSVVRPMMETFNSGLYAPHTVYHEDDLNKRLEMTKAYKLLEMPALNRMPSKDDFTPLYNDDGEFTGVRLTAKGRTLKALWPCPLGDEETCPATAAHYKEVGFHRPLKALLKIYHESPIFFLQQFMHVITATDDASVKPWMLRFYVERGDPRIGTVAHLHTEWHNWKRDHPDAGLASSPPRIEAFPEEVEEAVHGWDFAIGKQSSSDRTACCRMYRTPDRRFFVVFDAGRWRHDMVWKKVVTTATTDPICKPKRVVVESNSWQQVWRDEVKNTMRKMGVQDHFVLEEVKRTQDKDKVFAASGLPEVMSNGLFYVDVDDEESINEILSVTPDQKGGHDDILDSAVNAYMFARTKKGLRGGVMRRR